MSPHRRRVLRRQNGFPEPSGTIEVSDATPTASSLAQNTAATPDPSGTPPAIPLAGPGFASPTDPSTSATPSSTSTISVTSASSHQISLGAVIGACVAALVALILSVLLAFYCSKRYSRSTACANSRNAASDASRRRSHLQAWKRMDDGNNRPDEQERSSMKQRSSSGPLGVMFRRTNSNTSGEKSLDSHLRESVGTMQHFSKYHPDLAAEMASQGTIASVGVQITKPPPVLHIANRGSEMVPPISWDGETVGGDSFYSARSDKSPALMATEKLTPPATGSSLHHWESAEVVHIDQIKHGLSEMEEAQNPFSDRASSIRSSMRGQNPFFGARDNLARRTLLRDAHENPFTDTSTSRDSSDPIRSLIAALEAPRGLGKNRIVSVQSSVYSHMTTDDGDSAISVTAFPYPPIQVDTR